MAVYEQCAVGSVGAILADAKEALELISPGAVTTVVDRPISPKVFQAEGLDENPQLRLFGQDRRQLVRDLPALRVASSRNEENHGRGCVGSESTPHSGHFFCHPPGEGEWH